MTDCLFCKIIKKEIPAEIVLENEKTIVIKDINPVAPLHLLVIPKKHFYSVMDMDEELMSDLMKVIKMMAKEYSIVDNGFRIVNNCGEYGQQSVAHVHFHLLGGRQFNWPPG